MFDERGICPFSYAMSIKKYFLLTFFILLPILAVSQPDSAFLVQGYTIELPAGNVTKQRAVAIRKATKKGLVQLLQNITPKRVWPQHASVLSNLKPENLLQKFTIVEETTTPDYRLTLDLHYSRPLVRQLLSHNNIPFAESQEEVVLLVPVLDKGQQKLLWEPENLWRKALLKVLNKDGNLKFVLPSGDLEEMRLLTPQMAAFGASDILLKVAEPYQAIRVVVAIAHISQNFGFKQLDITGQWYGGDALPETAISLPFYGVALENALENAALQLQEALEQSWQSAALVDTDKPGRLFVRFAPQSAHDLNVLKDKISNLKAVEKTNWRLLSSRESVLQVNYFGEEISLIKNLKQVGVTLIRQGALWRATIEG